MEEKSKKRSYATKKINVAFKASPRELKKKKYCHSNHLRWWARKWWRTHSPSEEHEKNVPQEW